MNALRGIIEPAMSEDLTRASARPASRPNRYTSVSSSADAADLVEAARPAPSAAPSAAPAAHPPATPSANVEQSVAITLGIADGFKFGCGLLLAAIAFYFVVLLVVAFALVIAAILGLPLPFGLGGR
jgi:hypothetical protein